MFNLAVQQKYFRFSKKRYKVDVADIQNKNHSFYKARQLVMIALDKICEIMCPSHFEIKNHIMGKNQATYRWVYLPSYQIGNKAEKNVD